jgi:hypothetical protein
MYEYSAFRKPDLYPSPDNISIMKHVLLNSSDRANF